MAKKGRKGIIGWIIPVTNMERLLYSLHRITGIGLTLYLFIHIYETSMRALGRETWISTSEFLDNPLFHIGLLLVVLAAVYPYRKYHRERRVYLVTITMLILGIGVAIFALRDFLILLEVLAK